jgi:hypothetical protein
MTNDSASTSLLREAHAVVKSFPMTGEPTQGGGEDATNVDDPTDAYAQLAKLAEEQRARSPGITFEKAIAQVYSASENANLAARERQQNRPKI